MALIPIKSFSHTKFPDHKRRRYHTAWAETVLVGGEPRQAKIGFKLDTKTKRMRAVVFIDERSCAEFVAADDFSQSGKMVSLIKDGHPTEYKRLGLALEPYNKHVTRPRSFKGLAVLCQAENLRGMVNVARIKERGGP